MAYASQVPPELKAAPEIIVYERAPARERWSWALYDFANTIWSMNVTSLYFVTWLVVDLGASSSSTMWSAAISSILVAFAIPFLGAVSDARRRRKVWVVFFTLLAVTATMAIGIIGETLVPLYGDQVIGGEPRPEGFHLSGYHLLLIGGAYTVANFAYQAVNPFYNSMMTELGPPNEYGRLSGFGTAVGYVGTIVGVLLVAPFFSGAMPVLGALPATFVDWIRDIVPFTSHGGRVSTFVPTALLFLAFSLPLFFFNRDHNPAPARTPIPWRSAFTELFRTIRDARKYPGTLRFIVTSLIYQDAVGTITLVLGIYAIQAVGFSQDSVNLIFTVLPVTAVVGSLLTGMIVDRIGPKRTLTMVLGSWVVLLALMVAFPSKPAFWILGALIGLASFGGTPTAERPMLLSLVPENEAGRFFSLLLLSARAAAFIGPLIWGYTIDLLEPRGGTAFAYRAGLVIVAGFFLTSLFILRGVPDNFARRRASA
jgi:MFS transporter, UMF1 family